MRSTMESYTALVEIIGEESAMKLAKTVGGGTIYVPKHDTITRQQRNEDIKRDYGDYEKWRIDELVKNIFGGSDEQQKDELRNAVEAWQEAQNIIAEAQGKIDAYKQLYSENLAEANGNISFSLNTTATGDNSSLTDDVKAHYAAIAEQNLETYKSNLADMEYYLKMGYITNDEYYSKLENMRDKYLERDTDEWRSVNVELKKYYDSLTEEQKKAYEQQLKQQKEAAEQAQRERLASYNEEKSQLQFKQKTGQLSEKKYYEELAKIRDKYLE